MELLSGLLLLLSLSSLIYVLTKYIRYGKSRQLILDLLVRVQGRRSVWIREPFAAHRILRSSSSKGQGIEQLLSTPAWAPVLSLESVDGDQWQRMKKAFLVLRPHLPPLSKLASVTSSLLTQYLEAEPSIDSPALVRLVLHSMLGWLFEPAEAVPEFVLTGILEWRKELAIKGKGSLRLKLQVVDWIKGLIKGSNLYVVFGEKWEDPEAWSLILQPFFISPAINVSDIGVTLAALGSGPISSTRLVLAITYSHPFPVLERWFPEGLRLDENRPDSDWLIEPNTHVFLPMDEIGRDLEPGPQNGWAAFGAGRRVCGGQDIALVLCTELFSRLLGHPKFRPCEGHLYSGRDNDLKESWAESWFQVKTAFLALVRLRKGMACGSRK